MNDLNIKSQSESEEESVQAERAAIEAAITAADEPILPLPSSESLEQPTVMRGAAWTIAGFGVLQALRLGSSLILTRLVSPHVFGVINLVNLFNQGLHMFSDLGIRQCVVNSPRGEETRFLNTAWTIQVIRGTVLCLLTFVVCWPLGRFYGTPEFLWLVPIVGLTALFDGLNSKAVFIMIRRLERAKLVIRDLLANSISLITVVVWLWLIHVYRDQVKHLPQHQMFAFAACNVLSGLLALGMSYTLLKGVRNRLMWDPTAARELARFGGWIFLSTACTFLAGNLHLLYVGKLNIAVLASYNIAWQLARLPTLLLTELGHQLVFPLYSRLLRNGVDLKQSFESVHASTTGFAGWLTAGAFAACPTLVWLVYPDKFSAAGDYVRWLSVAAWFSILQTSSEVALLAMGQTRQVAFGQIIKLVLLWPLLFAGYHVGERLIDNGFIGLTAGYTLAEAARYVVLSTALAKQRLPVLRLDLILTLLVALSAGITILIGPLLEGTGGKFSRYGWRFAGESAMLTVMWSLFAIVWWPRRGQRLLDLIRPQR